MNSVERRITDMTDGTTREQAPPWTPWVSSPRVTMEYGEYQDIVHLHVLTDGVILYATEQGGVARMSTKDMREFGQLLIEGANALEAAQEEKPRGESS